MLKVGKPLDDMNLAELSEVHVFPFLVRLLIYLFLVAGLITAIVLTDGAPAIAAMFLLGLVYAHGVELQHQTLHNTGFPSKSWNRFVGFFLGLPLLVSFSDYQYSHLRHHRLLGTGEDREFFNYGYDRLTSLKPLFAHLIMLQHYLDVAKFIAMSCVGRLKPDTKKENAERIRTEYILMAVFLAAAVGISVAWKTTLFVEIWLLPLLVGIPTHALIELPEHWGRNHDTLNVIDNTRTIKASPLASWFTNGNNFHIEHHWLPSVPNDKFAALHEKVQPHIEVITYADFFKEFFGELYRNTFSRKVSEGERA